jgi:AcrR family transcriptional regulator
MTKPGRPSSRQAILDAAIDLLAETGAGHLTLDAVAQRAGVSKGGLLYNFHTKNALLAAMIEHYMASASALLSEFDTSDPGAAVSAVHQQFDKRLAWLCDAARDRTAHCMLAAIAQQPELLDPVRQFQRTLWEKVKQGSEDPYRLWLVWLASEGLIFSELLGVTPLTGEEREELSRTLKTEAHALQTPVKGAVE